MFQTAKPTKVFQDVVAQIEEAILTGRIKTGQTLPSERELNGTLQISPQFGHRPVAHAVADQDYRFAFCHLLSEAMLF